MTEEVIHHLYTTRRCMSCNQDLPLTRYKGRGKRAENRLHTMCNRCLYVRYNRPVIERKVALVQQYKVDQGCADCGFNAHPMALQFDHRPDGEKLFNIGEQVGNRRIEVIWEEIAKCDVVCANCHVIRTKGRWVPVEIEGGVDADAL